MLLASLAAVVGLWYSSSQIRDELSLNREQLRTAQEAQITAQEAQVTAQEGLVTDRYTAAVTNLGDEAVSVRLGGVYALQLLMTDSPQIQPIITGILAAHVRDAPPPPEEGSPEADVQAALDALVTRDRQHDSTDSTIVDLHRAHLAHADLWVRIWPGPTCGCGSDRGGGVG
ncbi:hypothetical protein [Streptomyces aidingensis]|uniref:Uncharacterized protein n=1 Tax=Streptomyces aidingensis TaxID=910347 RepID=A0A1I1VID5_9ACTN|nr:hypothetical protein [Streptomyces aidingensis]SFD82619.1 hypothetical protein SAMN05421773_1422 [Streptomyces aidingensis]